MSEGKGMPQAETELWLSTAEAAEKMGCSARHLRTLIQKGEVWAKRDGKNWLVHHTLSRPPADAEGNPNGSTSDDTIDVERMLQLLEEQINFLREQLKERDVQIQSLLESHTNMEQLVALEKQEKQWLLIDSRKNVPWWKRIFSREHSSLSAQQSVILGACGEASSEG